MKSNKLNQLGGRTGMERGRRTQTSFPNNCEVGNGSSKSSSVVGIEAKMDSVVKLSTNPQRLMKDEYSFAPALTAAQDRSVSTNYSGETNGIQFLPPQRSSALKHTSPENQRERPAEKNDVGSHKNEKPLSMWEKLMKEREEEDAKQLVWWLDTHPFQKDFYVEHGDITGKPLTYSQTVRDLQNSIKVEDLSGQDRNIMKPITQFVHAFHQYPDILQQMKKQGFFDPTPIQCQFWPIALFGYDCIGIAQTGTGKTLAYLLPAFIHIDGQKRPRKERFGPSCLVLTPTRELALQIHGEVLKYDYRGIRSVCVYGGGNRNEQIKACTAGVEIVVATPGRFNDLVSNGVIALEFLSFLVLDEADTMLDLGFEPQILKILNQLNPQRHTLMTSATWPKSIRRIATRHLVQPFLVHVGDLDLTACHSVTQEVMVVTEDEKWDLLFSFILDKADDITSSLIAYMGIECGSIHGNRNQEDREKSLLNIRKGNIKLLIATDVASRGLDIKGITHVFNFDFPRNIEDYVHRVGRTGRAGCQGFSITLVTRDDWRNAGSLVSVLKEANQVVPAELVRMASNWDRKKSQFKSRNHPGGSKPEWVARKFTDPKKLRGGLKSFGE